MAGIQLKDIRKSYGDVAVVHGITLDIPDGEFVVIVGPSGCGKSTTGRAILDLITPDRGDFYWEGRSMASMSAAERREARLGMQMIFQDPSGSLDPRKSVKELIGEPLKIYKACKNRDEYDARIAEIMQLL